VPNLKLKVPSVFERGVPKMLIFAIMIVSYFFVLSGVIYDMINEPPSIGSVRDEKGRVKPVVILEYRMNAQYMIEGFSAGMFFVIGGLGFLVANYSASSNINERYRYITFAIGAVMILAAYNINIAFLKIKVPGYGR
jgi:NADH:ubiquinone oxidoreductase subunit 5 (subunit L)/multisubunit Na+/H+ antiporter MnhA subunit